MRGWRGGRGHSARSPCWGSRPCRSRSRRPRLKDGKKEDVSKYKILFLKNFDAFLTKKSFGGFLPPITEDFSSYWRHSKTLRHIRLCTLMRIRIRLLKTMRIQVRNTVLDLYVIRHFHVTK